MKFPKENEKEFDNVELLFMLIDDPFFKVNLSSICVNYFIFNNVRELLLSISTVKFLSKKQTKIESYGTSKSSHQSKI